VHEVEFSPFVRGEWPKNWMISQRLATSESTIAFADDLIHPCEVFKNFGRQLLNRSTAGKNSLGRLSPLWHPSQPGDYPSLPAVCLAVRARCRYSGSEAVLKIFDRAPIRQIQMI